jgi:Ca2+-binding RTX toxin-like protein
MGDTPEFSSTYERLLWKMMRESLESGDLSNLSNYARSRNYKDMFSDTARKFIDYNEKGYFTSNDITMHDDPNKGGNYYIQYGDEEETYLLAGKKGSEYFITKSGDDLLLGERSDDFLSGGAGTDIISGGDDVDTVSYQISPGPIYTKLSYNKTYSDGYGTSDTLLEVENVIGSENNDSIYGDEGINTLFGGHGMDMLYGRAGNDVLLGGKGGDFIKGDEGDDIIIGGADRDYLFGGEGSDIFKYDATSLNEGVNHIDTIMDFQGGVGGDKIDVSELLDMVGYTGNDAIADGYINIYDHGGHGIILQLDKDGHGGVETPHHFAYLKNVSSEEFSVQDNLITETPTTLYAPFLGQSNAVFMTHFGSDSDSGVSRFEDGLNNLTNYDNVTSVQKDNIGWYTDIAAGWSAVNGDRGTLEPNAWWYPEADEPGVLAIRAVDIMSAQMAKLRAGSSLKPIVIWGQGETETVWMGKDADIEASIDLYKSATLKIFNYIQDQLGDDIEFYIMQTGRYNEDAAREKGISEDFIEKTQRGLAAVREGQHELVTENSDIHLAAVYDDLAMKYEADPITYRTDRWHLDSESYEIVGDRLAEFVAMDLGQSHVLQDPGPYPRHMLAHIDINVTEGKAITGSENTDIIVGTTGNDTIHAGAGDDMIVSGTGADTLYGDEGSDLYYFDPSVWQNLFAETPTGTYADYADIISDFETGENGDRLDISVLLEKAGYEGTDAIADGYLTLSDHADGLHFDFDADGAIGPEGAVTIAYAVGISSSEFDAQYNLVTEVKDSIL